jgi:hypothetical protein
MMIHSSKWLNGTADELGARPFHNAMKQLNALQLRLELNAHL